MWEGGEVESGLWLVGWWAGLAGWEFPAIMLSL